MEIKEAALKYAEMGFAVIPVNPKNKHPYTKQGSHDASKDPEVIKDWWFNHPHANVAIVTGKASGLVVIDEDYDEPKGIDGIHELKMWENENGKLPDTCTAVTGRGGYHLYYRIPEDAEFKNHISIIDGVDVRGEGGYVVAPPSIHANGKPYEWDDSPFENEITMIDDTVIKFLSIKDDSEGETSEDGTKQTFVVPEVIPEGKRNDTLFKLAASLWSSRRLSKEAVIAAVKVENNLKCNPPLPDDEIIRTVESATKYPQKSKDEKPLPKDKNGYRPPAFKRTEDGNIKQNRYNYVEAIEWDELLFGKIKYNIVSYDIFVFGDLPWEHVQNFREWRNSDDAELRTYLETKYSLNSKDRIADALIVVSRKYAYNPITDMLMECYNKWDKQSNHIEKLLPDYLAVERNRYNTEVMKIFMLGAIGRAFNPGCKFDYTVIIYGDQGCGKSTFLRRLAINDAWFNDNFNTFDGDKAFEKIKGIWIAEIAELLAVKKTKDVEAIKSFLTSQNDRYRVPYGVRPEPHPRFCVFAGTTNNEHFLTDSTGNRRYLPITAGKKKDQNKNIHDIEKSLADMKQAWGEAMDIFMKSTDNGKIPSKLNLTLPEDVEEMAKEKQKAFLEEDARIGIIQEWLEGFKGNRVCVAMLYEHALGNIGKQPSKFESNAIHAIMKNNIDGWKRVETSGGRAKCPPFENSKYGTQICYDRIPTSDDGQKVDANGKPLNPFETGI